jgi:hypothetical protein
LITKLKFFTEEYSTEKRNALEIPEYNNFFIDLPYSTKTIGGPEVNYLIKRKRVFG